VIAESFLQSDNVHLLSLLYSFTSSHCSGVRSKTKMLIN